MGYAGRVLISNGTQFDWKRTYCFSSLMNKFEFPKIIPKNTSVYCEVEYKSSLSPFKSIKNSKGGVVYEFEDAKGSFFIGSTSENGFNLFVEYDKLSNLGSKHIDLGWYNMMVFFISGIENNYTSTRSLEEVKLAIPSNSREKLNLPNDEESIEKCKNCRKDVFFIIFASFAMSLLVLFLVYIYNHNAYRKFSWPF